MKDGHDKTPPPPFKGRPRMTLPMQPNPVDTSVAHMRVGPKVVTAIHRTWREGHSGEGGLCKRCPKCSASGDSCHLIVDRNIPKADAPTFAVVDYPNPVWRGL